MNRRSPALSVSYSFLFSPMDITLIAPGDCFDQSWRAIASISTKPPLGNPATAKQERAG